MAHHGQGPKDAVLHRPCDFGDMEVLGASTDTLSMFSA